MQLRRCTGECGVVMKTEILSIVIYLAWVCGGIAVIANAVTAKRRRTKARSTGLIVSRSRR